MDAPIEAEIDRIGREIEQLKKEGDPEGRIADLNAYLRVLYARLTVEMQKDPSRWG